VKVQVQVFPGKPQGVLVNVGVEVAMEVGVAVAGVTGASVKVLLQPKIVAKKTKDKPVA